MIFRFNEAQLSKKQRDSLYDVLKSLEVSVDAEVSAVEFPYKLSIKDSDDITNIVWVDDLQEYRPASELMSQTETPEPEPVEIRNASDISDSSAKVQKCVELFEALNQNQQTEFLKEIWVRKLAGV